MFAALQNLFCYDQLQAKNIKISSGKISTILTDNLDLFHTEVDELLSAGDNGQSSNIN